MREGLSRPFWLAVILAVFALPLFIGLGRTDMENDEAIYSYAVDGILATGDWLNPPLSPFDGHTFLEKPPLKFWIVAAPIKIGLLPHNELGMRVWDVVCGGVAFLYVFALGRWLAGPLCGLIAVFGLFIYDPLLFEHGLRNNNMEAPLVLAYVGGVYHYIAWASPDRQRRRVAHAAAVTAYFFLGFMTKFVAALFLPILLGAVTVLHWSVLRKALSEWRMWLAMAAAFLAAAVPWFAYEYWREGNGFLRVMFAEHVYQRFTTSLDPGHIHPWNFYYVTIFRQLGYDGLQWMAVGGCVLLAAVAIWRPSFEKTAILSWLVIPLALMSVGSSKLHHYAYPFLPPLMLAMGFGPAWAVNETRRYVDSALTWGHSRFAAWRGAGAGMRTALIVAAAICVSLGIATLLLGTVQIRWGGHDLFRNSHVARPLVLAIILATLAGRGPMAAHVLVPAVVFVSLMPLASYSDALTYMRQERHPLRTARDCLLDVRRAELAAGHDAPGIYAVGEAGWFLHPYYYYFRDVGGWERSDSVDTDRIDRGLFSPGSQRPLLLPDDAYQSVKSRRPAELTAVPVLPLRGVMLLTPGPYAGCAPKLAPLATQ